MKIQRIIIENFQPYYGDNNVLEFSEGLNLVLGEGGKGKSKLFNAFYWVLFGRIYITEIGWVETDSLPARFKNIRLQRHEFINEKALSEACPGDAVRCSVHIDILDDGGNLYEIERSITAKRKQEEEWKYASAWEVSSSTLKILYDTTTGTKTAIDDMAESKIAELFPEEIKKYIWFQGETLDELIDFSDSNNLKNAVRHISYYPFYEKLSSIISKSRIKIESQETKHLKDVNQRNAEAKHLVSRIENLRNKVSEEENNEKRINETISKMEIQLASDEGKIKGLAKFADSVNKYDACEADISRINDELTHLDDEERKALSDIWVLRGTSAMIEKCKELVNNHVEMVNTAPERKFLDNPSRSKLEAILNVDHKCFVCGCPVDEAHPERVQWIKDRIRMQEEFLREMDEYRQNLEQSAQFNSLLSKIQDYPDSLLVAVNDIDNNYIGIEERIEKLIARRRRFIAQKETYNKEIEEIKRQHGVDPRKEAGQFTVFESSVNATRSNIEAKRRALKACQEAKNGYARQLAEAEAELKLKGISSGSIVSRVEETEWKEISAILEKICLSVQERARKELLEKIQKRANDFYSLFTAHDRSYKGMIEIDDNYEIKVDTLLNTSHEDRKKMSIINALLSLNQEALGIYYPFISDAPTSNFDPQTTHRYLMGIKDIFGQSIIMTKDVELNSHNYKELFNNSKVSRIYTLTSHVHTDENREYGRHEVTTDVTRLK